MLEPDSRVVLLDQLRPPHGYRLHAAAATTFTLELSAAVVPPLAFASFEIRGTPDPISALEAVRSCTDRVDVFCQAGQILVPAQHSDLMAYLEPMVHPVRRPKRGYLFHPKMWFLDYRAEGQPDRYRLLCSTRNLTDSPAWDAVVTLDGERGTRPRATNQPLSAFIKHLPNLAARRLRDERRERIEALAQAARYIEWQHPEYVDEVVFHALGIPRVTAAPDFSGYRHLVISPFCNDEGVAQVTSGNKKNVTLVSRPDTLEHLAPETLAQATTRILDPLAVLNDPDKHTDNSSGRPEVDTLYGLHAKVTVVERSRRAHLFIGSPNATSAAYGGNVEFAVELIGGARRLGVEQFLGGDAGFASILMDYGAEGGAEPESADELLRKLQNVLRGVAEVPLTLTVLSGTSGYDLHLESDRPINLPAGYRVRAELLTMPGRVRELMVAEPAGVVFPDVPLPDVTPFVVLYVRDMSNSTASDQFELSTVVHAALIKDPPNRLDEVLARQVDTPEKFLRFLTLLLGMGDLTSLLPQPVGEGASDQEWRLGAGHGVFEIIVEALANQPASLFDLDKLVGRLQSTETGRRVLPPGFDVLWKSVTEALAELGEEQ